MKAITVWQPWATLLATGQKHNETRSWKTSYRGEILIHAAKTDHSGILLHIPMEELKHFQDAGVVNKLPTGAIIPLEFCPWCGKEIKEAEDETEKENQQAE